MQKMNAKSVEKKSEKIDFSSFLFLRSDFNASFVSRTLTLTILNVVVDEGKLVCVRFLNSEQFSKQRKLQGRAREMRESFCWNLRSAYFLLGPTGLTYRTALQISLERDVLFTKQNQQQVEGERKNRLNRLVFPADNVDEDDDC